MDFASIRDEFNVLLKICWPIVLSNLLCYALQNEAQIFVGHLGPDELAAAALGNSYFNLVYYFLIGAATALDTLGSQAYGAGNTKLVRVWTQRSVVVLSAFTVPCAALMWWSEEIMVVLFELDPKLCADAAIFIRWLIPGSYFYVLFLSLQKYQMTQNVMLPSVLASLLANVVNLPLQYWMVNILQLGLMGSSLATSAARLAMLLALAIHVCLAPPPSPLPVGGRDSDNGGMGVSLVAPHQEHTGQKHEYRVFESSGLWRIASMGCAGAVMLALEAWMFEMCTIFAGHMGDIILDAHNTLLLLAGMCFTSLPFGISIAATIRVGNLLGAGFGSKARLSAMLCIASGSLFMLFCGMLEPV